MSTDFFTAAYTHEYAPYLDEDSPASGNWWETLKSAPEFVTATAVSAGLGVINIPTTLASIPINLFGGDYDGKVLTENQVFAAMDNSLGTSMETYYNKSAEAIDLVGFGLGSLVPGMLGVKVARTGLNATAKLGETSMMARSLGTVRRFNDDALEAAKADIIMGSPFTYLNTNALKLYAAGAGHGVVDALAYNTAATLAMHTSPYLEDKTMWQLTKDTLSDSVIYGGLFGSVFDIAGKSAGIFGYKKAVKELSDDVASARAVALAPFGLAGDTVSAGAKYTVNIGKKATVVPVTPGDEILMKLSDVDGLDRAIAAHNEVIGNGSLSALSAANRKLLVNELTKLREEAVTKARASTVESLKKIFGETEDIADINGIAKQLLDKDSSLDKAAALLAKADRASRLSIDELTGVSRSQGILAYPASATDKFTFTTDIAKAIPGARASVLRQRSTLAVQTEDDLLKALGLPKGSTRQAIDEAAQLAGHEAYTVGSTIRSVPKFSKKGTPLPVPRSNSVFVDVMEGTIVEKAHKATAWDLDKVSYVQVLKEAEEKAADGLTSLTPLEISALYRKNIEHPLRGNEASNLVELDMALSKAKSGDTIKWADEKLSYEEAMDALREGKNDLAVNMTNQGFSLEQVAAALRVEFDELARLPYPESVPSNLANTKLNRPRYLAMKYARGRDFNKWELEGKVHVAAMQQAMQKEIDLITVGINPEFDGPALVVMDAYTDNFVAKTFSWFDAGFGKIFEQSVGAASTAYNKLTQRAVEARVVPVKTAIENIRAQGVGSPAHSEFTLFNTWNKIARNKAGSGHSIAVPQADGSILMLRRDAFENARTQALEELKVLKESKSVDATAEVGIDDILALIDVRKELGKSIGAAEGPAVFRVSEPAVVDFLTAHAGKTEKALKGKNSIRQFRGNSLIKDAKGNGYYTHYEPSVNVRNYQHVLVIKGDPLHQNPLYANETYVFAARSADELRQAEAFANREGLKTYTKGQTKEFYKALDEYEQGQDFQLGGIKEAMQSQGKLTSYLGTAESLEDTANRYLDWHLRDEMSLTRQAIALKEHEVIDKIRAIDLHDRRIIDSRKGNPSKLSQLLRSETTKTTGPEKVLNTIFNTQSPGIVNAITKGLDDFGIGFATTVRDAFAKINPKNINNLNDPDTKRLTEWLDGVKVEQYVTKDILDAVGIKSYDSPAYAQFVRMSNMALIMGQLRLDAINSLINILSLPILGSSTVELAIRSTITQLQKQNRFDDAENIRKVLYQKEGKLGAMPSTYARMAKQSIGRMEKKAKDHPILGDLAQGDETIAQFFLRKNITFNPAEVAMMDLTDAAITGIKSGNTKAEYYTEKIKTALSYLTKPTDAVESRLQFIAADSALQIAEAGKLGARETMLLAHTMVNKLQGNFTAAMKPQIFQGITGSALGLFQSYQARLIHRLSDVITDGNKRMAVEMAMLQTSIFGGKSLPFFDSLNAGLVAEGNQDNQDIYSSVYGSMDRNLANAFVYGIPSALLGLNVSSRGNTTPRVPTALTDIPAVNIWYNQLSQIKDVFGQAAQGGDISQLFNHSLQHNVFNRPLQQFAVLASGYSTTKNNKLGINMEDARLLNDNNWIPYRIANGMRIAGTRPLDEQVFLDTVYRWQGYAAGDRDNRGALGRALSSKMLGGEEFSPEEITDFMEKYLRSGGTERGFNQFLRGQASNSSLSAMDRLLKTVKKDDRAIQLQYMLGNAPTQGRLAEVRELIPELGESE